ncbi:bifunctional acetaldehyde-CoA/alcohol dehydrogenase [Gynuella sunshinyii]|uniref:Aldehyde-alcohol dehydrogenase n=1 Tax=Gynuella sunshinyii YC6258 TaxID=1445510 RepID=A0A0C5VRU4_9GAMM|nr:bifunctional acetaldehyde-CoA/alcohol dehydrogenase [Gynuella sunshinyii]AJQ96956.1 alcohol dehydrogenase, class IV [Gynuella sunshinyii YC6258]
MANKKVEASNPDKSLASLDALIERVKVAQRAYARFTQAQVDEIFRQAALAANNARISLAKMAVEETGMGIAEDKAIKNHFASEIIYNKYKDDKTCGILEEDTAYGIMKVAEPVGILAGVVPTTNPTSTAIFKSLLALKTRNGIVFSPHPRAKKCTALAAKIVMDAAIAAGAPKDIIACIEEPTVDLSQHLMRHPDINMILATGGPGMVRAAYSSGKPAIGVGAGNTPAVIDESAHIKQAVSSVLMSKTFDNGVICASEQSVVVVDSVYDQVKAEFQARGAYVLSAEQKKKVGEQVIVNGSMNPAIVGQPAYKVAAIGGVEVPKEAKVIIAECDAIDLDEPFAHEKLSPTLAMYRAKDFDEALDKAVALVELGGMGHTSVLYTDQDHNRERIEEFGRRLKTGRILINMPASQGAIGDLYNFKLAPSLTLGCGSWGGNSVSENVGPKHLINVKTVASRRENMLWHKIPKDIYFRKGALPVALSDLKGKKRALVVTDPFLFNQGYTEQVTDALHAQGLETDVFYDVEPDPTLRTVNKGVEKCNAFKPDVIVAFGGGSPMDAAKIMWVMYEHPEVRFEDLALRFMDIRKRIYHFPKMGIKALMVAIPTTSGTGSEVTPFAVVTDEKTGVKYPIADYELTPNMAIIDPDLVMNLPQGLTAYGGVDALTHALEAYVSLFANEFTNGQALEAIRLLFKYLPSSYKNGKDDPKAREKVHYAATMAGIAFANAFLGVCHSMAHKLGAHFHVPHGLANALLISEVVKYNATDVPVKQGTFPQYKYPQAKTRYARIADYLELGGNSVDEKVELLVAAIDQLKAELNIPKTIRAAGVNEVEFMEKLDLLSEEAFDDQCTPANPRYPMISEIKDLYVTAFYGQPKAVVQPVKEVVSKSASKKTEEPAA